MNVLGWIAIIAAILGGVLVRDWWLEQQAIRREARTGLTPPNGNELPEYRVPVHWVRAMEDSNGKMMAKMDEILVLVRRVYDGRSDEEL